MSVIAKLDELLPTLDARTPEVEVLLTLAYALGLEIDTAQLADDQGKTRTCASAVRALQGVLAEVIAKGRKSGNSDEAEAKADWTNVTPIGAAAGPAAVRDGAQPAAGNARPRGGRGGKAAPKAADAVAATRRGRGA